MILTVEHVTRYEYDAPMRGMVQSHRLHPSSFDGQKVLSWNVTVTDGVKGGSFRDGAGDLFESWSVIGPVSLVEVRVSGQVETTDMSGILRGHREVIVPTCYLQETAVTRPDQALRDITAGIRDMEPLQMAHEIAARIADAIVWTTGTTGSATTAAEALASGQGVCQDHSHAVIAAARHAGLPARYVSGYLVAEGVQDAAHAWAEIFVKGLGWVGFDAANKCCPDDRYIRLASGLDATDAAPIRGSSRGGGAETLEVTVAVGQAQQ
ncbi:transglutaminase family protein [Falsirhodobacter sp. alg1]|uniref:transglutaminase family protein n=1 Tax=Falsirhodobacter sp. alg1 TaxID=1472418 RepID=UPI0005ED46D4|nr:transglutaminase family protein [Falsirhodobacter sp. alg1]